MHHPRTPRRRTSGAREARPPQRPLPTWAPLEPSQLAEALWLDGVAERRRRRRDPS